MNTRPSGDGGAVGSSASKVLLYAKRSCGFVSVTSWTYVKKIVLWGTFAFNRMHLLPGIQDTGILWVALFWLGPNLRMGWIPGIQLSSQQIQMLCPLSMLPTRLMCIPHALPMVVPSINPLVMWRVRYSEKRRTLSMRYTGISLCMCRHPSWLGAEPAWRPSEGWPHSIDASWCAKCLRSPRDGSGPQWDCH